jgi:hypothetical protein
LYYKMIQRVYHLPFFHSFLHLKYNLIVILRRCLQTLKYALKLEGSEEREWFSCQSYTFDLSDWLAGCGIVRGNRWTRTKPGPIVNTCRESTKIKMKYSKEDSKNRTI